VISVGVAIFQNVIFTGKNFAAADVGSDKIYPHEVNFYYVNSYMNFVNSYGDYLQYMGLDASKPLKEQSYSEDMTWHDYFLDSALKSVQQVKMLYHEATAAGLSLDDKYKTQIDADISSLETSVAEQNMDLPSYLTSYYGKAMTVDEYKRILGESYLAQQFGQQQFNSYKYSDDQVKKYYEENKKDFDVVDYRYFFFSATPTSDNPTDADKAAAKTSAKSLADIMKSAISDEQSFINLSKQNAPEDQKSYYEDPGYTLRESASYSSLTSSSKEMADWLIDAARVTGDTTVIQTDSGSYVVYMKARYRNDYNAQNVRHILIKYNLAENETTPTDEEKAKAKSDAEAILKEWKDGEATEASFAKLAEERSTDTGSASNGGLYENVYKGQMVAAFQDWTFDPARKPGDTGIVESDYGYHVMYYVSSGAPYWTVQVDSSMRNKDYDSYTTTLKDKYPLKQRSIGLMAVGLPKK
jgi:parvulin-like peptidyl-prolyl isomerase